MSHRLIRALRRQDHVSIMGDGSVVALARSVCDAVEHGADPELAALIRRARQLAAEVEADARAALAQKGAKS